MANSGMAIDISAMLQVLRDSWKGDTEWESCGIKNGDFQREVGKASCYMDLGSGIMPLKESLDARVDEAVF